MRDIRQKLVNLFKEGFCTPQIARIAKKIKVPSTTIHYNIKKLEEEGVVKTYKAVFDYKKIEQGYCTYLLVNFVPEKYGDPEKVCRELAKREEVEALDIITGDYEIMMKLRCKDSDEYYLFVKDAIKRYGFGKAVSLTSLKQIKTEFVEL